MPRTLLLEATADALAAINAGDLDALQRARTRRQTALAQATLDEQKTALAEGARLLRKLAELKRDLAASYGQLDGMRQGIADYLGAPSSAPCLDLRG